ncbi:Ictacalcin [Liparis tanakae]|uniref:Protein S100 n=1 Tax=Liparis tanakae TaxID=230148 RepID=A0A4Z2FN40_9TELE|nr:Ictacalcin [Liparis tanakae]
MSVRDVTVSHSLHHKIARKRGPTGVHNNESLCPTIPIMSDIQEAMALLINAFDKYAGKEGDKDSLSKAELKELLQNEFGELLGKASDKDAVDRIFKGLDANKDNSVDFKEFVTLVTCLTVMCHEHFCKK